MFGKNINRLRFTKFVNHFFPNYKKELIKAQGGLIPIYNPNRLVFKHIKNKKRDLKLYTIGDAGGFVKATSGGGIIPGLESVKTLKKSIDNNINFNTLSYAKIGYELHLHLISHNIFSRFNNNCWENLLNLFNQKKLKSNLENISRDDFKKLAIKSFVKEPKLLKLLLK
jgi:flavin-dependent dehydrogenase